MILLLVLVFFGDLVLAHVYGDIYERAWLALVFLCVGEFVNVAAGSCGLVLMMSGHHLTLMWITIASSGLTFWLCAVFSSLHGPVGAAAAVASGIVVQNILMLIATKRLLRLWTHIGALGTLRAVYSWIVSR